MSASADARRSELDAVLDSQALSPALADELFAVVGLLQGQSALRGALSDPTAPEAARQELARRMLDSKVSSETVAVVSGAAGLRWTSAAGFVAALERQGARALIGLAQAAGELDEVEDQLFKLERLVSGDNGLRGVLEDRTVPVEGREQLIVDLAGSKVLPTTLALARRAARSVDQGFAEAVADDLALAAAARDRSIAYVTVARPLTAEQAERLRRALGAQAGREVNLQVNVDPDVIGGVRVRLGDEVIDGTMSARLEAAERELN